MLSFVVSDAGLLALQAGIVASPRPLSDGLRRRVTRLRGPGWALIPVASIVGVIFLIRYASGTASWLTYLALVAVPVLAVVALGWAGRWAGGRWSHVCALTAVPLGALLFVLAWRTPASLAGQAAASLLSGLSCVTLGVVLGAVTPARWLKFGIIAMACADSWLVLSDLLQAPNNALVAAAPGSGLPQLQSETFQSVNMGYGDLFVAGLLGAVYSGRVAVQRSAALLTLVLAGLFDLLFFVLDELPATVPVALALICVEVWGWRRRRRGRADDDGGLGRRRGRPKPRARSSGTTPGVSGE